MTSRPVIVPGVLSQLLDAAPARLQKKLDRDPKAAEAWTWQQQESQWQVICDNETVTLTNGTIESIDSVKCTCLLSPRCFHVLAVLNLLEVRLSEVEESGAEAAVFTDSDRPTSPDDPAEELAVIAEAAVFSDHQRLIAQDMFRCCSEILASGLRSAGTTRQSRLLRSIHNCRAEGLHRLAAAGLRVMQDLRLLRSGDDDFQSSAAVADLTEVLEVSWRLSHSPSQPISPAVRSLLGTARRQYLPIAGRKLYGLFSEPVLTRSGYADPATSLNFKTGSWRTLRPAHKHATAPCHGACPAGEDQQAWLAKIQENDVRAAWETLVNVNPMPAITGRVCPHPCETACNRGHLDQPIAIHNLERWLGDEAIANDWPYPNVPAVDLTRPKVAVIGAGPSGLSAAYHLTRRGYRVTILEALTEAGGLLKSAIPMTRLPRDVLDAEISRVLELGIDLQLRQRLGRDFQIDELGDEYAAVFLGIGC
ncbi:MAG: FAD-dependent oxidoreductase, partial [Planctomycetaceae bacterium]|nr:FAD-dependent oxidoreductase [Planctomycetaceae bacterium]